MRRPEQRSGYTKSVGNSGSANDHKFLEEKYNSKGLFKSRDLKNRGSCGNKKPSPEEKIMLNRDSPINPDDNIS